MIDVDFQFRAVGQGAFYTGIFNHDDGSQFSFVYDCGSESSKSYINSEIQNFANELDGKPLDILFISHFHADHINKIKDLYNSVNKIEKVIIPYLTPDEITLAIADGVIEGNLDQGLVNLINDPLDFFGEKTEEIIFIHPGNEEGGSDEGESDEPTNQTDPSEVETLEIDFNWRMVDMERNQDAKIKHCYSNSEVVLKGLWEFRFYNKPRKPSLVSSFVSGLKILVGSELTYEVLENYIAKNTKIKTNEIKELYEDNFGARQLINETSLVVYHHSLLKFNVRLFYPYRRRCYSRRNFYNLNGTLLTGDITLTDATIDNMILKWNNRWLYNVLVFQIPHHGSKKNTKFNLSKFPCVCSWVINFGLGNKHKHPHQKTIDNIINNKFSGKIIYNTQLDKFKYGGKII